MTVPPQPPPLQPQQPSWPQQPPRYPYPAPQGQPPQRQMPQGQPGGYWPQQPPSYAQSRRPAPTPQPQRSPQQEKLIRVARVSRDLLWVLVSFGILVCSIFGPSPAFWVWITVILLIVGFGIAAKMHAGSTAYEPFLSRSVRPIVSLLGLFFGVYFILHAIAYSGLVSTEEATATLYNCSSSTHSSGRHSYTSSSCDADVTWPDGTTSSVLVEDQGGDGETMPFVKLTGSFGSFFGEGVPKDAWTTAACWAELGAILAGQGAASLIILAVGGLRRPRTPTNQLPPGMVPGRG